MRRSSTISFGLIPIVDGDDQDFGGTLGAGGAQQIDAPGIAVESLDGRKRRTSSICSTEFSKYRRLVAVRGQDTGQRPARSDHIPRSAHRACAGVIIAIRIPARRAARVPAHSFVSRDNQRRGRHRQARPSAVKRAANESRQRADADRERQQDECELPALRQSRAEHSRFPPGKAEYACRRCSEESGLSGSSTRPPAPLARIGWPRIKPKSRPAPTVTKKDAEQYSPERLDVGFEFAAIFAFGQHERRPGTRPAPATSPTSSISNATATTSSRGRKR